MKRKIRHYTGDRAPHWLNVAVIASAGLAIALWIVAGCRMYIG